MTNKTVVDDTIEALRRMSRDSKLRPEERAAIEAQLGEIDAFADKLEHGRVEIAAFGEVSAGKSALLNALAGSEIFRSAADHGTTREIAKAAWQPDRRALKGLANSELILVDTPGINEARGEDRAALAAEAVRYTDLVLFVTDSDLNKVEMDALRDLHELHKPIILVINKIDIHDRREVGEIHASVMKKVAPMIGPADVVFAAGSPREREREIHRADGSVEIQSYKPAPVIEDLQVRILEVLDREGKAIVALNANLFAAEVGKRINAEKQRVREKEAISIIHVHMGAKALAVALVPGVFVDILAGVTSDVVMIRRIGLVYGNAFDFRNAQELLRQIVKAWGVTVTVEYVGHLLAGLFKTATFGAGMLLTAIPQGLVAAWASYVIGGAANIYFREGGSWGGRSPKDIIDEILASADKDAVLGPIKERLTSALRGRKTQASPA